MSQSTRGALLGDNPVMFSLQTLRNAHLITRLVLVWLALFIGAALATPLLKSQSVEMVCSGMGGTKMVQTDADEAARLLGFASLDCPACLPLIAPPVANLAADLSSGRLSHVFLPLSTARLVSLLGQPWQARAPPVSLA